MDHVSDSLPGAKFRITDGTLYLDFQGQTARVGICLTTAMREHEQTRDAYAEWEDAALAECLRLLDRDYENPPQRQAEKAAPPEDLDSDIFCLHLTPGLLRAFGRWLARKVFSPQMYRMAQDRSTDVPTMRFKKTIPAIVGPHIGTLGDVYEAVIEVMVRYDFKRTEDISNHQLVSESKTYDQIFNADLEES